MTERYSGVSGLRLNPGDVLAGKYRVERVLGQGGMGVVVSAHHLQLDEKVALKFLLPEAVLDATAVARFLQEARAAAKVKNEHVARVIDVGQLENGSPYMVMEYLDGHDLAAWLHRRGPMPCDQAVDFVLQACEALADAHSLGIVHRDLKPANLFCIQRSDGQLSIKVLDFGISKITTPGDAGHGLTRTSTLMGSPAYMSPEQMKLTKGVDARADIWSLGVILFELIAGRPPFTGEAVTDLAIKIATEPAPPLRDVRRDVPAGLAQVVARCLEKDRAARFQTVGELAIALRDFGSVNARISVDRVLGTLRKAGMGGDLLSPASRDFGGPSGSAATQLENAPQTAATWGQTAGGANGRGKAMAVVGILVALAALTGALALVVRSKEGAVAPASSIAPSPVETAPHVAVVTVPPAAPSASAPPSVPAPSAPAPTASAPPSASTPAVVPPAAVAEPPPAPTNRSSSSGGSSHGGHVSPPHPTAPTATPTATASAPPAKTNCNPPYVIDAHGDRQYKPECL